MTAVRVRLFGPAREAAGTRLEVFEGTTVGEIVAAAVDRYGPQFAALLPACRIWLNGEPVDERCAVAADDELAVLPPVSGGAS